MDPLLTTALRAADAAATVHARWARRIGVDGAEAKGKGDFVSRADREAQDAALAVIRGAHPGHRILAEEDDVGASMRAASDAGDGPLWVVDPLDGTANFLHGHPMYAASVAVWVDGRPEAAAVACSTTGERWWAVRGGGAFKSGLSARVSAAHGLDGALVGTGFPFKHPHLIPGYLEQLGNVLRSGSGVRRGGSAALDLCYVAEGRLDAFWELHLAPWDFAAGILIVEEAGGVVSGLDRGPLRLESGGVLAACSATFMDALSGELGLP